LGKIYLIERDNKGCLFYQRELSRYVTAFFFSIGCLFFFAFISVLCVENDDDDTGFLFGGKITARPYIKVKF